MTADHITASKQRLALWQTERICESFRQVADDRITLYRAGVISRPKRGKIQRSTAQ